MNATISRICPMCRKESKAELSISNEEYLSGVDKYNDGALLQDAFPELSASEREFVKTGFCFDCQSILFAPPFDDDDE